MTLTKKAVMAKSIYVDFMEDSSKHADVKWVRMSDVEEAVKEFRFELSERIRIMREPITDEPQSRTDKLYARFSADAYERTIELINKFFGMGENKQ